MDLFDFSKDFIWQDVVLTAGSIAFLIALFPTIFGPAKPAPFTSLLTGSVLLAFAVTYGTLDLRFATITTTATGLAWLVILWQSLRQKGKADSARPGAGESDQS